MTKQISQIDHFFMEFEKVKFEWLLKIKKNMGPD